MLDPACQRFLRVLALGGGAARPGDPATKRENFRKLLALSGDSGPAGVVARDDQVDAVAAPLRVRIYRPEGAEPATGRWPTCLFFHGGGFVAGSIDTHDAICRHLTQASGCQIISVGYRLAPAHPYPAPIDDGLAILDLVVSTPERFDADMGRIAVAGDSVGGGLAAAVCQRWQASGRAGLALQVLICPALDAEPRFPSRTEFANGFYIDENMIAEDLRAYRGSHANIPTVFENENLAAMPPAIVHVAECDPFRDEGLAYAEKLKAAGVAVTVTRHPGMLHLFYGFSKFIPAGQAALQAIGREMKLYLG